MDSKEPNGIHLIAAHAHVMFEQLHVFLQLGQLMVQLIVLQSQSMLRRRLFVPMHV
jgi:hypothetical protein